MLSAAFIWRYRGAGFLVEACHDGNRVHFTSALYAAWVEPVYPRPAAITRWTAKADVGADSGLGWQSNFPCE